MVFFTCKKMDRPLFLLLRVLTSSIGFPCTFQASHFFRCVYVHGFIFPTNGSNEFSYFRWQNRVLKTLCTSELQNKQQKLEW
jgi:hypothetical protein